MPSMSAVAAQRQRTEQAPPKTLAVFADPVFAATDPRLVANTTGGMSPRRPCGRRASSAYPQLGRSGRYRRARRTGFSPGRDGIRRQSRAGAQRAAQRLSHRAFRDARPRRLAVSRVVGIGFLAVRRRRAAAERLVAVAGCLPAELERRLRRAQRLRNSLGKGDPRRRSHRPRRRVSVCRSTQSRREPLAGSDRRQPS